MNGRVGLFSKKGELDWDRGGTEHGVASRRSVTI